MNSGKNGSSGPKTLAGKARSSRNSSTHGLFEKELRLSDEERTQYGYLKDQLATELQPITAIQKLVFDDVLACAWRMKRALGFEQMQILECLATDDERSRTKPLVSATPMGCQYSSLTTELRRQQLRFLDELESRFRRYPIVSQYPEMEKQITDLFGVQFWRTLTEWEPANPAALQMTMTVVERSEIYGTDLPEGSNQPEAGRKHVKADEYGRMQMMTKIVELERQHLLYSTQHSQGGAPDDRAHRLDLFLRYQTKSRRDFYHALCEYRSLKEAEKKSC